MRRGKNSAPPAHLRGIGISAVILLGWLLSLLSPLTCDLRHWPSWEWIALVLIRTQLQTGLFIVGHDAMHGHLWPGRRWNDALGALALTLYAALPYRRCRRQHRRHHRAPATALDPDCPADRRWGLLGWYGAFMGGYLSLPQMGWLLSAWALLACSFQGATPAALVNLLLICTLPLLLSSWQLFLVGTYLPHRGQRDPGGSGQAASLDLPPWLSLLACYHFGYHHEHHTHPELSWFQLPAARRRARSLTLSRGSR